MPIVPITRMGFHCNACEFEWLPKNIEEVSATCPHCDSPDWNKELRSALSYEEFSNRIAETLRTSEIPLTWTEIRTKAKLPQKFPNNQWVHRMESDIHLLREKDPHGIINWRLEGIGKSGTEQRA